MSSTPNSHMLAAAQAYREGRLDDAARSARQCLVASPGDLEARILLGVLATKQGRLDEAIAMLSEAVRDAPTVYQAHYWLATALRRSGNPAEALKMAQRAAALKPNEPQACHQLGMCCFDLQDWENAETYLQRAAKLAPQSAVTQFSLGCVFEETGRREEARRNYKRAIALDPHYANALHHLGAMLIHELDYVGAQGHAQRILDSEPGSSVGNSLMASALIGLGKAAEAKLCAERVLAAEPDKADSFALYGTILQSLGQMEEANTFFRRAVESDPLQGHPYYGLVRSRKMMPADAEFVANMERALADPALRRNNRSSIEFALGKARADLGEYEAAMRHYDAANALTREIRLGNAPFDKAAYKQSFDFPIETFDRSFVERYSGAGSPDTLPVWVFGMMRSGTTLAEQILTCHPDIAAAGEQRFWMEKRRSVLVPPEYTVDRGRLGALSDEYLEVLRRYGPQAKRVIDKLPGNYAHLGLINVAFPNARMIHMRRHPVDTCLSIWTTPNSSLIDWGHIKENIVFVYREYLRVMEHWRAVLPEGAMLEVDYEDLVSNPADTIRRMVDFCGVEWDERCLRPENNDRAVATPSDWQVRQPIYRSAVERWRPFEPWLGEFREMLGPGEATRD